MKVIVGLGNPGSSYEPTRHNVGFRVVHELATRHHARITHQWPAGREAVARYGDWESGGTTVRVLLPHTMMNRSGEALGVVEEWQVAPSDILLVCDDVNLPLGTVRLRPQGSAGGHHGLISCLERLQTEQIPRLRIGVGSQPLPGDLTEFVLSPFRTEERPTIDQAITRAVAACEVWVKEGIQVAMNRSNNTPTSSQT